MVHVPLGVVKLQASSLPPGIALPCRYAVLRETRSDEVRTPTFLLFPCPSHLVFSPQADAQRVVTRKAEGGAKVRFCRAGGLERERMSMLRAVAEVGLTATINKRDVRELEIPSLASVFLLPALPT